MKKVNSLFFPAVFAIATLCVSCRDTSGNKSGTRAGQESNGDTRGTESPRDNEGSGSSKGATPSKENNDQ